MEISQFSFVLLAVYSVFFGAILGGAYDVLRIIRVLLGAERNEKSQNKLRDVVLPIIKRKAYPQRMHKLSGVLLNIWIAIGDVIFALSCGALAVLISYAYNSGRVRAVIFIGLGVGFLLYYFTVGKLVMKASELVAFVVRSVLVYIFEAVRFVIKKIKIRKIKKKGA